jgi:hypothetical protein
MTYNFGNLQFTNILHYFNPNDSGGLISDMKTGIASLAIATNLVERSDFLGTGIAVDPKNWIECDESRNLFFSLISNIGCDSKKIY